MSPFEDLLIMDESEWTIKYSLNIFLPTLLLILLVNTLHITGNILFKIFMRTAEKEYLSLVKRTDLTNKYAIRALQAVAETNDHFAADIVCAIKREMEKSSDENKEALISLLQLLAEDPSYYFIREPGRKRKREETEQPKRRKTVKKEKKEKKEKERFFPYPPEYFLLKLVTKEVYRSSYEYYTNKIQTVEIENPSLDRKYLIVPHLQQAVRLLYTAEIQCKVCGLRFDSSIAYAAHAEMHQKKSQMGRTVEMPMWRAWLLEPGQWNQKEQKVAVTIKSTVQEKVSTVPVRGDREQKCTVCGDGFDIIWSDENECWSFSDAIITRTTPRQLSHRRCIS